MVSSQLGKYINTKFTKLAELVCGRLEHTIKRIRDADADLTPVEESMQNSRRRIGRIPNYASNKRFQLNSADAPAGALRTVGNLS